MKRIVALSIFILAVAAAFAQTPPTRPVPIDPFVRQHQTLQDQITKLTAIAANPAQSQAYVKEQLVDLQKTLAQIDQRAALRAAQQCLQSKNDYAACGIAKPKMQ